MSFISKKKWRTEKVSQRIRIRIQDFYSNAIGEEEYTYVTPEVYEALTQTFRKEAHAEEMRDIRVIRDGYVEGDTETILFECGESLEDIIIRQIEMETLRNAIQTLSDVQKARVQMYYFEGMNITEIGGKQGVNVNAVWKSLQLAITQLKKILTNQL